MELVRRADWGAAPPKGRPVPIAAPVRYLFLHHSAGPDGGAQVVRSIQDFHQHVRGWQDVGYTWLYSPQSRTFYEGRGPAIHGAHTRGYNKVGHGLCVLGNYDKTELPVHAIDDLAEWAYWHGGTWGPDQYIPHRQMGETACPGRNIMAVLDTINDLASGRSVVEVDAEPDPDDLEMLRDADDLASMSWWEREVFGRD